MYTRKITQIALLASFLITAVVGCGNNKAAQEPTSTASVVSTESEISNNQVDNEKGQYIIKGSIKGVDPNALVVLHEFASQQLLLVDSVRTDDKGQYSLTGKSEEPRFFYLTVNTNQPPGVPLILENGKNLNLDIELGAFIETKVKGDAKNMKIKQLYDIYMSHNKQSKEFQDRVQSINPQTAGDSLRTAISAEYNDMQVNMRKDIEGFIESNKGSMSTYFAVTYVVPEAPIDMLESALVKMKTDISQNSYTAELENRINSIKPLSIGGLAPDISLANPEGDIIKLSSLRGKVVMIDFWASWCGPCRKENPNVVKVYQKYHDKGFEIYGVSLDRDRAKWQQAIAKDGLTWPHVSDLKGWQSSAAGLYKVTGIPKTFLLDEKGRILAMDLRGQQLEAKLAEIFD
jgi:peroxiredoxin